MVCFKEMTDYILRKLTEDGSDTKEKIVKTAAKIIKEEIREMKFSKDSYPSIDEITSSEEGEKWIPESLKMFMKLLVPSSLKQSVYFPSNETKKCYCTDPVWRRHGY